MEDKKMAYIAGLIDGDGSLSLCKKHEKNAKSPAYFPLIQLSKSACVIPKLLQDTFGGSLVSIKRPSKNRVEHRWKLEKSKKCLPFLTAISPYLHNKYDQSRELIEFIEQNPFIRGLKLDEEDLIRREKSYIKMKRLNAKRDTASRLKSTKSTLSNDMFWPYFAGLMDTDGSFSIKREKTGAYSPSILLSLVNSRAINFIERNCMYGRLFLVDAPKLKQKFYYRLSIHTKDDVQKVIKNILPYLLNKKMSAEILLQFCEGHIAQHGRYKKTKEQCDFREDMYKKLINANYGVYKPSLMDLKPLTDDAEGNKAEAGDKLGTVNVVSEKASLIG